MTLESSISATVSRLRGVFPAGGFAPAFFLFLSAWWITLCVFYLFPEIDLMVAQAFFQPFSCGEVRNAINVCGHFPYSKQALFQTLRKILFYLPSAIAILLLARVGLETWRRRRGKPTLDLRLHGAALTAFVLGPYVLVNLWLKTHSNRPRPYETDVFGGKHLFEPAGSFDGTCNNNCSFISGEAAGAGWLACLILLVPVPLRTALIPPILAVSFVTPALRVAYGGHYISDAMLGWLSSPVIFFGVLVIADLAHRRKYFAV